MTVVKELFYILNLLNSKVVLLNQQWSNRSRNKPISVEYKQDQNQVFDPDL